MSLHGEAEVEMKLPLGGLASVLGEADDASVIGSIAAHQGDYEPELMAVLATLVSPDSVCVDVGANVGAITLALSSLCPDGFIYAFEPATQSFGFLKRNLARNGVGNATAQRLALSDAGGEATLSYNREFAGGAFISDHVRDGVQETVRVGTIDHWAQQAGLDRLDLIKVDVEGYEQKVLSGARATIKSFRPTLVVELNPITLRRMQKRDPRELFGWLLSVYGGAGHLAVVAPTGHMVPLWSWGQLRRQLAEAGICNLVSSAARLLPGLHPGVAGPREVSAVLCRSLRRYGRFSLPPWAVVYDPHVTISFCGRERRFAGRPWLRARARPPHREPRPAGDSGRR